MPKYIFLFLIFQILLYNTYGQDSREFTIDGRVIGRSNGKLYLMYSTKNKRVVDSAEIKSGTFFFHGSIDEPTTAELTDNLNLRNERYGNYLSDFYLEPSVIKLSAIDGHFAEAKVTGSKTNEDYQQLIRYTNPVFKRLSELQNQVHADSVKGGIFSDSIRYYTAQLKKFLLDFIESNPDSYIGILATQRLAWLNEVSTDSILATFNHLTPRIKNTIAAKKLNEALVHKKASSIGNLAQDFTRKDLNGKIVTLSSFKGRYVLLDFWASWCGPCRTQTPHIKKLYEKYGAAGLKVIAISCDSKYDAWQKAILQDKTESFINILSFSNADMEFLKSHDNVGEASFEGELRKQFNLKPIPVYILIDPKGVIIGRFGATEEASTNMLNKKLNEIFDRS